MDLKNKRALVFFQHNPFPPTTGAHQRCLAVIRALREVGYEVALFSSTLLTNTAWNECLRRQFEKTYGITVKLYRPTSADERYVKGFWNEERRAFWGRFAPPGLAQAFADYARQFNPDVVIVNYSYFGALIDDPFFKKKLTILETLDLYSVSEQMQDVLREHFQPAPFDPEKAPLFLLDEGLFKDLHISAWPNEYAACDRYDVSVIVSPAEAELVRTHARLTRTVRIPITADAGEIGNTYQRGPLFVAALNMMNAQGYLYFIRRVLPLIHGACPSFALDVAGSINQHFLPSKGIQPKGYVENLDDLYRDAPFTICPMLAATGQQIKVVESMSLGVPVVIHANVADSSPVVHGVNGFIAHTPEQFASYCLRLHADRALCKKMGEAARETVRKDWSHECLVKGFKEILACGGGRKQASPPAKNYPQRKTSISFSIILDAHHARSDLTDATISSLLAAGAQADEMTIVGGNKHFRLAGLRRAATIAEAYENATGAICAILRAGDRLRPDALKCVAKVFENDKRLIWIQGRPATCDEQGELVWVMEYPPDMPDTLSLWTRRASIFWRRDGRARFDAKEMPPSAYAEFMMSLLQGRGLAATLEALLGATYNEQTTADFSSAPLSCKLLRKVAPLTAVSRDATRDLGEALRSIIRRDVLDRTKRKFDEIIEVRRAYRRLFIAANEQLVLERWRMLAHKDGTPFRVALYGAGAHSQWLLRLVRRKSGPQICAILDDRAAPGQRMSGIPVRTPKNLDISAVDAIVLSSDVVADKMAKRCRTLYGKKIRLVQLYRGLPPGPYPKIK